MIRWGLRAACPLCGDRLPPRSGEPCGRCQRIVCGACSRRRGRSHESVLCAECAGLPRPTGFRRTAFYRAWRRLAAS